MSNLTIAFLIGTVPVLFVGWGWALDAKKGDFGVSFFASLILFVCPWWTLYFLIRAWS